MEKKYSSAIITLFLLFIENVIMTLLIYINPTRENILNVSGIAVGMLVVCEFAIILLYINEKADKEKLKKIEDFEEIDTNISIIEDEEEIEINITINTTKKVVYFSEMTGSGCKYPYKNMEDLKKHIQFYLEFYHPKIFNSKGKETKNE